MMEGLFPFEIFLSGIPISLQSKNSVNRDAWKQRVAQAASDRQRETYELGFLDDRPLAVTIFFFSTDRMEGDVDNIVKPIIDAMIGFVYLDDHVIERVTVQKFEPGIGWNILAPTNQMARALDLGPPFIYIRVDDDLSWRNI